MRLPPFSPQTSAMSGEDWGDSVPVEAPTVEVKLFGKWSPDEVHVNDISLAVSFSDIPESVCLLRNPSVISWLSRREIEYYSIMYFERIAKFFH